MDVAGIWDRLETELIPVFAQYRSELGSLSVQRKKDKTLLTQADLAIQDLVVATIGELDPDSRIVAEERMPGRRRRYDAGSARVWVIDPIDGTSEFISKDGAEFCSVVCLVDHYEPTAAFVLAPELGLDRRPLTIRIAGPGGPVMVDGVQATPAPTPNALPGRASLTRSTGTPARLIEEKLTRIGCQVKSRTTSQSLDMIRTCIDLSTCTSGSLPCFDLFYRETQKIWDGLSGRCLARATGHLATNRYGAPLTPLRKVLLDSDSPTFDNTLVSSPTVGEWFRSQLSS